MEDAVSDSQSLLSDRDKLIEMARTDALAANVMFLIRLGDTPEEALLKGLLVSIDTNIKLRAMCEDLLKHQPARPLVLPRP